MKIRPVGAELFSRARTDEQTDGRTDMRNLVVTLRKYRGKVTKINSQSHCKTFSVLRYKQLKSDKLTLQMERDSKM